MPSDSCRQRTGVVRLLWLVLGAVCLGLGALGLVLPGFPGTVFFIAAAASFTRSSPRLERWVLGLPAVGGMIRDHRAGLGMPRRAKVLAVGMIAMAGASSAGVALQAFAAQLVVVLACLVGVAVVVWRVPTRERVLAQRARGGSA